MNRNQSPDRSKEQITFPRWPSGPMWLPTPGSTTPIARSVGKQAQGNTELEIEYEKILNRVKQTRESVIKMTDRHFTAPVDEIAGTVE